MRVETTAINTMRTLAIDAIEEAKSGHPGTAMAVAPLVYTVWQDYLRFDPDDPIWPNRDRFVLSVGHASTVLYTILHLARVKAVNPQYETIGQLSITLDDLKRFRQIDSKAPGHPEYRWTSGVEATTGPLGQGVATSVGMAIAGFWMANYFNRPGFEMFDYDVLALTGDGCLMEGISYEAASLAGHFKLSNLCWLYDSNRITIEGRTDLTFTEDVAARFEALQWNVLHVDDANDLDALRGALDTFKATDDKPTLIIVESVIAWGSPNKQDSAEAHGNPLGEDEIRLTKQAYGWPEDAKFLVPDEVYEHFAGGVGKRGRELRDRWMAMFEEYEKAHPELADQLYKMQKRQLPDGWDAGLPSYEPDHKGVATRESSGEVLNVLAKDVPWILGGAADVSPSTKTWLTFGGAGTFQADDPGGRNFHFGVREQAMAAIANGLSLSKIRPYLSAYLIFSDYARNPIRLSALMEIPVIHIFTHDSIGAGEDGPTHQPIEQILSLRAIPHLVVLRPADANEVVEAWKVIMQLRHRPAALILTRQNVPTLDRSRYAPAKGVARGAYVLADTDDGKPDVLLLATGSEVPMAVAAYEQLKADGTKARVVSMPSWELFEDQPQEYRDNIIPPEVTARVSIEQGSCLGWDRYVGPTGHKIGMETFGASAPLKQLQERFGFTADHVVEAAKSQLS